MEKVPLFSNGVQVETPLGLLIRNLGLATERPTCSMLRITWPEDPQFCEAKVSKQSMRGMEKNAMISAWNVGYVGSRYQVVLGHTK